MVRQAEEEARIEKARQLREAIDAAQVQARSLQEDARQQARALQARAENRKEQVQKEILRAVLQ